MMLGIASKEGRPIPRDPVQAGKAFAHACELGLTNACSNLVAMVEESKGGFFQSACDGGDGESCFLLGSLSYSGRGVPKDGDRAFALLQKSCVAGWSRGCGGLGECYRAGVGTAVDNSRALENFEKACRAGIASSCFSASQMYRSSANEAAAQASLRQGCAISAGFVESSAAYDQPGAPAKAATIPPVCSSIER